MKRLKTLCIIILSFAGNVYAAPIVSGSSGDWNNPSTWIGGVIPSASDIVTIANGHTVIVTANASCAAVVIGNGTLDQSSILTINAGILLTVSGNITITSPLAGTVDNILDVNTGSVSCSSLITSNSGNDALRSIVTISTGTLSCSLNLLMANNTTRNKLIFSGSGILQVTGNSNTLADAQFTASTGTVEYKGTAQSVLPLSYYTLKCSGSSVKYLTANTILTGDLVIAGSTQLDVSNVNNYNLSVAGNWTVTSTSPNPFIERKGTVTFNGTTGIQILTTTLSQENFYNLVINNTAGNATTDIQFNKNCFITQAYTHTSGILDLKGYKLTVLSDNRLVSFTACNLSGGKIISSVAGSQISFTDSYDSTFVNFTGTKIGDNNIPVILTINTGRINIENLTLYGTGNFTKRLNYDDIIAKGGNKFYSVVTFTLNPNAGNWYTGAGNGAMPDSFFATSFFYNYATNVNSKFILGANSSGNYYGDDVTFHVRAASSTLIGNSSGAANGTSSSHYFNKQVNVWLTKAGSITFAEGQSLLPSSVTFNKKLYLESAWTATGNMYVGKNVSGSSISFTNTGQIAGGNIYGTTPIYLYNITQTGSLPQTLANQDAVNGKIIVGDINGPCTWNGPVSFTAIILDLAYNSFNGSSNIFNLINSTTGQSCTGGNTFATGTSNSFNNNGTADWYLATAAPDDYNGNVFYRMNSTGAMYPAYNSNCTYAADITILPSSDTVFFAAAANGRVTIDGNVNSFFVNNSSKPIRLKRLTMNKSASNFTLYNHIYMPAGGDLILTGGRIITSSTGMIVLQDETCTVTSNTAASTSYIDGPMRIDVSTSAPITIHFPIGKVIESRPVDLTIQHTSNTSYSYTAEMLNGNANTLGWTKPASVYNVSTYRWWDITRTVTSSSAAAPTTELVTSPLPVVSFYYGLNDKATTSPVDVTIVKNTYNALTTWIDIGATGATNAIGKVTCNSSPSSFNSFSRFTLGFYGIPPAPIGRDSSRCGTGSATITATPVFGEMIDWYAAASGGAALATNTTTFVTPVIATTTTYYAGATNTRGYVSATRTAVTATIYTTPSITSFSPAAGEQGTVITITGTDFNNNVSAVTFGGVAASSFTVNSSTQITAVVGTGATGSVAVTNNCGTGSKAGFIFNPLTVWTGAVNTSWTNAGNWDDGVPTSSRSAVIPNVFTQPLISSNQSAKSITIQAGAIVDIAAGNSLTIIDSLTNNGDAKGGGNIVLAGTASQPIRGTGNYTNLTLNNNAGAVISSGAGNMVSITDRYTPTAGTLTTNNNFTLKSTSAATGIIATGAAGGGYINGKIILERYIPARRAWRLINFPVTSSGVPSINTALQEGAGGNGSSNPNPGYGTHITGGSIANGFDQNQANNPSMKEFVSGAWVGIITTNATINNQLPYFVFVRGSRANNLSLNAFATADNTTLRLSANIKQGNQTLSINGTGWQLTGNPFPAVVNLDAMATGNSSKINRNFIFWDPKLGGSNNVGGFVTASYNGATYDFTPTPVSSLSEYAQPFAGFYVDAIASGNVSIAEANKCNCGNGNVFRPIPPSATTSKLHVSLHSINTDGTSPVVDGAMTAFDDKYNNDKDSYDAAKMANTLTENIAISKNENKFSIERRKAIADKDTVYLNISNMRVKNYQLEIRPENFDPTIFAYLEDSYTAERKPINLSTGGIFEFSIINNPAVYAPGRFRIVFEKDRIAAPVALKNNPTVNPSAKEKSIKLLQNPVVNNTLQLVMQAQPKGNYIVTIINNEGKEIARKQFSHDGTDGIKTIAIKKWLPKGILTATVKNATGKGTSFTILTQ